MDVGGANGAKWCILRTGGPQTLPLQRALQRSGIAAWTPTMVTRRRRARSTATIEIVAPIVPTFVFAPIADLVQLLIIRSSPFSTHPSFSIVRLGDQVAFARDRQLGPLREEEDAAAARHAALLKGEADAAARVERAALLRTAAARRKALRAQRRSDLGTGSTVKVDGASAFDGMTGVVRSGDGKSFMVAFGGLLDIEIEAWQLVAAQVQ